MAASIPWMATVQPVARAEVGIDEKYLESYPSRLALNRSFTKETNQAACRIRLPPSNVSAKPSGAIGSTGATEAAYEPLSRSFGQHSENQRLRTWRCLSRRSYPASTRRRRRDFRRCTLRPSRLLISLFRKASFTATRQPAINRGSGAGLPRLSGSPKCSRRCLPQP